jgi:copper chaperone NosL
MFKLSLPSKIILAVCAIGLLGMLALPIWKIYLTAPQYPEGLEMKIWADTITGDVKVISALNHYIGMRAISVEMFPEFQFMGNIIIAVAIICLLLALIGRWWSALTYFLVIVVADSAALYDFWRWGYDYGHNLDPKAPIVIPGMAYQPPVLGYKKLLNFEAWSLPDLGGWILIVVSTAAFLVVAYEWWNNSKKRSQGSNLKSGAATASIAVLLILFSAGCSSQPQPINFGKDNCDFCKMTLMDKHYGAEIITKKGKVYKFDDLNCFVGFEKEGSVEAAQIAGRYVVDYQGNGQLIAAETAFYLYSNNLKTPMASGVAAFADEAGRDQVLEQTGGETKTWQQTLELF